MKTKRVVLLCILFSFIGYGVSYIFTNKPVAEVTPIIEAQYAPVSTEPHLIAKTTTELKVKAKIVSVPKTIKTEKILSPKESLEYGIIRKGTYNKGDAAYDGYLFPLFQHYGFDKFQVQGNKLLADATEETRQNAFPTIKVFTPEYDDDTIYQNEKEQTSLYMDSEEVASHFGQYDDDFSLYATEVFSSNFSDKVDDIYDMRCRKTLCVFFAKLNRVIDLDASIELNDEIKIKLKEMANTKGFSDPGFSKSYSEYNQELRVSISFYDEPNS